MRYMREKIARKIAFSLWNFETSDNKTSEYFATYSKSLKLDLEDFLNKQITDKEYLTLLHQISEFGFTSNFGKLTPFLINELNKIYEQDQSLNKLSIEIDD